MANPFRLQTSSLPSQTPDEAAATVSPARGAEMRNFLQTRLQKNRAPPLVHSWDFWHDRQERPNANLTNANGSSTTAAEIKSDTTPTAAAAVGKYEDRLEVLASISDVKQFWSLFNNFDISRLALRDSIHLFHHGVKPVWEDPRNARGGSWTFRVPKQQAQEFWKEVCMMAIGEQLQQAVESPTSQVHFRDDICGVSLGVRFNSVLIQIWNRDGEHKEGIDGILQTLTENLSAELKPKDATFYYKKHSEHAGFAGSPAEPARPDERTGSPVPVAGQTNGLGGEQGMMSLNAIVDGDVQS